MRIGGATNEKIGRRIERITEQIENSERKVELETNGRR